MNATAEKTEEPLPYLTWDTCDIAKYHAEYLREEDPELSESDAETQAFADSEHYEHEWEFLLEELTEKIKEINPDGDNWYCAAAGLGWRRLNGHKTFSAETGKEMLGAILPDTECTFRIYVKEDNDGGHYFYIVNSHHDAMGEVYEVSIEDKAPCGCGLSDCDPDTYHNTDTDKDQRFCRYCDQDLPEGYKLPEDD